VNFEYEFVNFQLIILKNFKGGQARWPLNYTTANDLVGIISGKGFSLTTYRLST